MEKYSKSGEFGKVSHFAVPIPSKRFRSLYRVVSAGWHRVNSLYHYDRSEGLDVGLLLLTVAGKGYVRVGGASFEAVEGSITVIPQNFPHAYGNSSDGDWEFYWMHFQGGASRAIINDVTASERFLFKVGTDGIQRLIKPFADGIGTDLDGELEASESFGEILNTLLRASASTVSTKSENAIVNEIILYLGEHAQGDFSLDELAKHTHYSKEYLIRLFKRATGMTPYHYRQLIRLRLSCRSLEETELTIGEIATASGYSGISSYSSQFKKHFGISPVEYRQLYKVNHN